MTRSVGQMGLIFIGSPPSRLTASRMAAKSTTTGTPLVTQTTDFHNHTTGDTNNRFPQPQAHHWWYKQHIFTTTVQITVQYWQYKLQTTDFHNHRHTTGSTKQTADFHNHRHSTGNTNNIFSQPQAPHWQYKTNNRFPQPQAQHRQHKQQIFTTTGTSLAVQNKQQISTITGTPPPAQNKLVSTTKHRHTTGIVAIQTTHIHNHRGIHSSPAMQIKQIFITKNRKTTSSTNKQEICTTTAAIFYFHSKTQAQHW